MAQTSKDDSKTSGAQPGFPGAGEWNFDLVAMMEAGRPASSPIEAWISLFPTSPLFGVRWAMWDLMRGAAKVASEPAPSRRPSHQRETEALAMKTATAPKPAAKPATKPAASTKKAKAPAAAAPETADVKPTKPSNLFTAPPARVDDLKMIKGVGPRLETRLNELGIYSFSQLADFQAAHFAWLDDHLAALFRGRGLRDGWADQARALEQDKVK